MERQKLDSKRTIENVIYIIRGNLVWLRIVRLQVLLSVTQVS